MALLDVVFRLLNKAGTSFIEPRREDGHGSTSTNPTHVDIESDILPIGQGLTGTERALVTHSVIQGFSTGQGGGYHDVKVTPSGALTVEADIMSTVGLTNAQLRATPVPVALDSASLIALENVTVNVEAGASVGVNNFPTEYPLPAAQVMALAPLAVQPVSGTVQARDAYSGGETLPDQAGNGSALTFTFSSPVQLVYAQIKTGLGTAQGRADPFGGIPASSTGIPLDDGVPQAMPVTTDIVRVFAPIGATVSVWGYRYG